RVSGCQRLGQSAQLRQGEGQSKQGRISSAGIGWHRPDSRLGANADLTRKRQKVRPTKMVRGCVGWERIGGVGATTPCGASTPWMLRVFYQRPERADNQNRKKKCARRRTRRALFGLASIGYAAWRVLIELIFPGN